MALLMVSGHNGLLDGSPSASYLQLDAGPEIQADLISAGFTVSTTYFVDDAFPVGAYGGYLALIDAMEFIRDNWAPHGTRVVVIAHSHGGVWAHGAIEAVPGLAIRAVVDLDCNSYGWGTVGHTSENGYLGGDPRDAFDIGFVANVPAYPSVPSEQTGIYDLEDVVFPNVANELEVRSGDSPIPFGEWYDEKWNLRIDGSTAGLYVYFSNTTHGEVHQPGGTTLAVVRPWIRARLAS